MHSCNPILTILEGTPRISESGFKKRAVMLISAWAWGVAERGRGRIRISRATSLCHVLQFKYFWRELENVHIIKGSEPKMYSKHFHADKTRTSCVQMSEATFISISRSNERSKINNNIRMKCSKLNSVSRRAYQISGRSESVNCVGKFPRVKCF